MQCCVQARVPTPAREAQEATSSRPSSQEIASQIEGFEDDFKVTLSFADCQLKLSLVSICTNMLHMLSIQAKILLTSCWVSFANEAKLDDITAVYIAYLLEFTLLISPP